MPPLSDLHAMLGEIERTFDAARLNEIVNHPAIYPFVRGPAEGPLDLSEAVTDSENICFLGEHGALVFRRLQPGVYECHAMSLPSGRGRWTKRFVEACFHKIFVSTDCVEILARCPERNLPVRALARSVGGTREFTAPNGWVRDGKPIAAEIFGLTIQAWARSAKGLVERGRWFHHRLQAEFHRHGKVFVVRDEQDHHRAVGLCLEMILSGQTPKANIFYSRVATLAGYGPIEVMALAPLAIDIGTAILIFKEDDFWMPVCRLEKE